MVEAKLRQSFQTLFDTIEPILVSLHAISLDIELGSFNSKKAEDLVHHGSEALSACDALIQAYLMSHTSDPELDELFMQVLVSAKPQILGGLDGLMAALHKPSVHKHNHESELCEDSPMHQHPLIESVLADKTRLDRSIAAKSTHGVFSSSSSDDDVEEQPQTDREVVEPLDAVPDRDSEVRTDPTEMEEI
jgi:hypothetical protein